MQLLLVTSTADSSSERLGGKWECSGEFILGQSSVLKSCSKKFETPCSTRTWEKGVGLQKVVFPGSVVYRKVMSAKRRVTTVQKDLSCCCHANYWFDIEAAESHSENVSL